MTGNFWEWLADCYRPSYAEAPWDGSAYDAANCEARSIRGGSWGYDLPSLRSADRSDDPPGLRADGIGMRVARDLGGNVYGLPDWDLRVYENPTHGFSLLYPARYISQPATRPRVFSVMAPCRSPVLEVLVFDEMRLTAEARWADGRARGRVGGCSLNVQIRCKAQTQS